MSNKIKVGVIITDNQDRILLIKEKIEKNPVPLWNIVKGTYGDSGPETIFETAIRETKEEAGVNVELIGLLGCYISQQNDDTRSQFTFLAKIIDGTPTLTAENEQILRNENITELKWFNETEIREMKASDFILNRTYVMISDYLQKKIYSLEVVKQVEM